MNTEEWKQIGWPADAEGTMKFRSELETNAIRGTQNIMISFTHTDPAVAQTGVKSIVKAYAKLYADMNGSQLRQDLDALEDGITKNTTTLRTMQQQVIDLSKPYGSSDLSVLHDAMQTKQVDTQQKLLEYQLAMEKVNLAMASKKDAAAVAEKLTPEDIALSSSSSRRRRTAGSAPSTPARSSSTRTSKRRSRSSTCWPSATRRAGRARRSTSAPTSPRSC
jgi:uncharacterized protein involved in exopolysaccharide biosynthesis